MKYLVIAFIIALSGCANVSIPDYHAGNALLIIPKSNINSTNDKWACRFEVVISEGTSVSKENREVSSTFLSNSSSNYALVDDLPPGNYYVSKISRYMNPKWRVGGPSNNNHFETNIPFRIVEGQITILDVSIDVKQAYGKLGDSVYFGAQPTKLKKILRDEIVSELKAAPNFSGWKITTSDLELERSI